MHTVFISYSSEDKDVAFGACKALEAGGVKCWIAPRDVMAGRPDIGQISEAIRRARVFVLVLSRKSDQSGQVVREVEWAAHSRLHLIVFQIEDFEPGDDLGYFLSVEHRLNAFEGVSPETHFAELLQQTSALVREGVAEAPGEQTKPRPGAEPAWTEKFANYHIFKRPDGTPFQLGSGAMGVTYKAFDTSLNRPVALKVIAANLLGSDEARRRFLREVRAAARIQHPHVAAIHHLGQEGEDYFYTMELVDGEDMERYVQARGPLSPAAALRVVLQVAEALEAAQVHKLIHRDIKPANIMARVNRAGKLDVKLIDFGLAKGAGPGSQDLSLVSHSMTFVGSPAYASPEQCEMSDLDTRSDIYSLGATLWYLLSGKPPFVGNVNQVLIAHVVKPPPFGQLQGVPDPVAGLLCQMLAKSAEDRPKDPQALQEAIEAVEAQLAGDPQRTLARASADSSDGPVESLGSADSQESSDALETLVSPSLDVYQRVEPAVLVAERYRLIEEQPEGNGGRLFLAHDEKAGSAAPAQVALKLVHPEIAAEFLDLLKDEIDVIKGASHPNLVVYSGLESAASGLFIVREWVHGFLLYDLLRLRRSLELEEVLAVLETLPATLDFISERGLGLVDVSIRKLFVLCPVDVRPDELVSLAKGDARAWGTLKLNPLSFAPLLFRERRDGSSQTLVPSSRVLSITQAEAGIRGTKAVQLLGRLVYELISGRAPSLRANERPSPLPPLNEAGNRALWKAWASASEAAPYRNCEEFWRVFKESVSDRIRPVAPPPAKPEAERPSAERRETEAKERLEAEQRAKERLESVLHKRRDVNGEKLRRFWVFTRKYSKTFWSIGAAALIVFLVLSFLGQTKVPISRMKSPKPPMSDEQIRAENEIVFKGLGVSPKPPMSDEQIRAQNEIVFKGLGVSPKPPMSDEQIRAQNEIVSDEQISPAIIATPAAEEQAHLFAPPTRYFNDFASLVKLETVNALNRKLADFERQTSNQVVVVIYPKFTADISLEAYAQQVFRAWKVGQKGRNNGVIIFVFVQDRKIRIQTGSGLEKSLPDKACEQIIRMDMQPRFTNRDFDGGIEAALNDIMNATRDAYKGY